MSYYERVKPINSFKKKKNNKQLLDVHLFKNNLNDLLET